jgi:hypothetical protein
VLAVLIPYLAMPFDLVPDFIPIVGHIDDALLVRELWPGSERKLRIVLAFAPALDQRVVGEQKPPV